MADIRQTNSNGDNVAPTLTTELARQTTKQLEAAGGYVLCRPSANCEVECA